MYQTTQAAAQALNQGPVSYRLLSEHVPLRESAGNPLRSGDGLPLFVVAQGVGAGNGTTQEHLLSLSYTAGCCDGDIGIGNVCSAALSGTIQGVVSLLGETLRAELGVEVSGETVWLPLGRFVVDECTRTDDSTSFSAHDANYYALSGVYTPHVASGASVSAVLADVAGQCGLEAEQTTLNMGQSITVSGALTGRTCRDMLGWLAMLCGKNCVLSREGKLRFVWFSDTGETVDAQSYYDGALNNGGVSDFSGLSCTVPAADSEGEDTVLTVGRAVSALQTVNPFMTQSRLESIWYNVGGWTYPAGEVEFIGGALFEPGDLIWVTNREGVSIRFPVMQMALTLDGGCRCALTSWGKAQVVRENPTATPVRQQLSLLEESTHRAMLSANGKNKVFHQPTAPTAADGLTEGDTWFDTLNDNRVNTWTGSAWSAFELGEDALADLSITNAKIRDGTIQNAKIANLDAGKITTGVLDADRIGAGSITADKIDVTSLFSQDITCTNRFQLDTEHCKLESSGSGFALYVENPSESYETGVACFKDSIALFTGGTAALGSSGNLSIDSNAGQLHIGNLGGSNYIRLNRSGGIWLHAANGEINDPNDTTVVQANRFQADTISEGGTALAQKYCKKMKIRTMGASISVGANTTANGSFSVAWPGYGTPIAVAGFRFPSTYSSYMTLFRSYLDGSTYYWAARNHTSNAYTGLLEVNILYME